MYVSALTGRLSTPGIVSSSPSAVPSPHSSIGQTRGFAFASNWTNCYNRISSGLRLKLLGCVWWRLLLNMSDGCSLNSKRSREHHSHINHIFWCFFSILAYFDDDKGFIWDNELEISSNVTYIEPISFGFFVFQQFLNQPLWFLSCWWQKKIFISIIRYNWLPNI